MDAAAIGVVSKCSKTSCQWPAEVRFHDGADIVEGLGWHMVAEQPELADELGREDTLARGQDLPKLDVGRPKALERLAEPVGQAGPGDLAAAQFVGPALFDQAPHEDCPAEPDARDEHPPSRRERGAGAAASGTWAAVAARSSVTLARQGRGLPVRSQGGFSLNAPKARSGGPSGSRRGRGTGAGGRAEPGGTSRFASCSHQEIPADPSSAAPSSMSELLKPGDPAPPFNLPDQSGHEVSLSGFRGRKVWSTSTPKPIRPGALRRPARCATYLGDVGTTAVIGISPDPPKRQAAFDTKYSLGFPLLSDVAHTVAESYGVWVERSMYGRDLHGDPALGLPCGRGRDAGEGLVQGGAGGDRRKPAQSPRQVARPSRLDPGRTPSCAGGLGPAGLSRRDEHQAAVVAPEAERVGNDRPRLPVPRAADDHVELEGGVDLGRPGRRGDLAGAQS